MPRAYFAAQVPGMAIMKIVVVNGFISEAIGDAALLSVLLEQLTATFPEAQIQVSTLDDPAKHPDFEGYRNLGSSRRYGAEESVPKYRRALRKLLVTLVGNYWPTSAKHRSRIDEVLPSEIRRELIALREANLVVSVGGGYLNGQGSISGDLAVLNMLMPLRYAGRMRKIFVCGPQSYGPFGSHRQVRAAQQVLGKADLLLVREAKSIRVLEAIGISSDAVVQTIDSAFAFRTGNPTGWRTQLNVPDDQLLVGMTARQWKHAPDLQGPQEAAFAQLIDHIQSDPNRAVVLIPMVVSPLAGEDDREVHRRIAGRCTGKKPILIEDSLGHHEVKDLTSSLDLMVGMRFHSVIFSLTNRVPSIAIEYHHKASGIMEGLGLEEWVVRFDGLSGPQLIARFDRLLAKATEYREHLQGMLPVVIEEANRVKSLINETYIAKTASQLPGLGSQPRADGSHNTADSSPSLSS